MLSRSILTAGLLAFPTLAEAETPNCSAKRVALSLEEVPSASLFVEVCGDPVDGAAVQVLLHGGAYDHRYWDWPHASFVEAANDEGYVTLNVDRLGYGFSTRPDGRTLTFALGALAIHQLVEQVSSGSFGFKPGTIILNGHSMGGIIAELVAAQSNDVDAIVISGLANSDDTVQEEESDDGPPIQQMFTLAAKDPRFSNLPFADTYLTTAPTSRVTLFHGRGAIQPSSARMEEVYKHTLSLAEIAGVQSGVNRPPFVGKALYVLGQYDVIACQGKDCHERFSGSNRHAILDSAGHSLNTSAKAEEFYALTFRWLSENGLAP